jgi:hypothetical protein
LAFFPGDGTGKFGSPVTRPSENLVGSYATNTMQVVDVNKDGLPDIVATDLGGVVSGVHVYLSEGDGTFKHSDFILEDGPFVTALNAAAADMDEDGCPDVVASTDSGTVYVFHGNCDGTFAGFPNVYFFGAGDASAGLALADMNGDGHLDVVTSGIIFDVGAYGPPTGDAVAVLFGDGKGKLTPGHIYRGESGMFSLAVGDLNGDSKLDVVTANQDSDSVSVYINDGKGGLGDPTGAYVGFFTDGVTGGSINAPYDGPVVADVNGDGKPDIAFLEYPTPNPLAWNFTVLLNDGTGHFGPPLRSDAMEGTLHIQDLQLVDIRGTGKPDLVVLGGSGDVGLNTFLGFAPNHGDGTFGPLKLVPLAGSPWIFAAGDFDGDGKLDLVITGGSGQSTGLIDRLTFMKGNGDGTFTPGPSFDFGPRATTGGAPRVTFVGDFNGDHKLDLIVGVNDQIIGPGSLPHPVFEFLGNGDGTFQQPVTIIPEACCLAMADVNHDGHPDLIELVQPITLAGFSTPAYKIHLGQPDGSFKDGQTYAPFAGLIGVITNGPSPLRFPGPILADFNGDSNLDILVPERYPVYDAGTGGPSFARGYFQVLLGNGDGTFTPDYTVFNLGKIFDPDVAADVNGDGRADLIEVDPFPSSFNVIPATTGSAIQAQLVSDPVLGGKGLLRINLGLVPSSATTIALSASDSNIAVASSVTIPAGSVVQEVPFTIGLAFNPLHVFALRAQLGTDTAVAYGTVGQPGHSVGFQLSLLNTTEATGPGNTTANYGLGILSVNGYSTSLQLQCQGLPAGSTCQFDRNPATLLPGTFATVALTISVDQGTARGFYPFTIVASDVSTTSQIAATLGVADFNVSVSPASRITFPGQAANYTLTIASLFGWSQNVQLSCPVTPPGPKCSLDGAFAQPGQIPFSIDTQSVGVADYTFIVTGSSSGTSHSASAQLKIEDASLMLSKTSATVPAGSSTDVNVTLNSLNGFGDQFTFVCLNPPSGVACSFSPQSAQLPANGTVTSVLTVHVNSRPTSAAAPILFDRSLRVSGRMQQLAGMLLALVLIAGFGTKHARERLERVGDAAVGALTLFLLACLIACGGSGTSSGVPPSPPGPPPPPPVTVNLRVQATSASLTKTSGAIVITIP